MPVYVRVSSCRSCDKGKTFSIREVCTTYFLLLNDATNVSLKLGHTPNINYQPINIGAVQSMVDDQ
jgi:hypothetical protein